MKLTINEADKNDLMSQLHKKYSEEYNFLYDNYDNVAGENEAMEAGDEFIRTHKKFMTMFNKNRFDIISSDREVAALALALNDFDLLDLTDEQICKKF